MALIEPCEYDVIVAGTGLTESIIAAACSRIGKTVLHLDTHQYYGEQWTSYTLSGLEKQAEQCGGEDEEIHTSEGEKVTHSPYLRDLVLKNVLKEREDAEKLKTTCQKNDIQVEEGPSIPPKGYSENEQQHDTEVKPTLDTATGQGASNQEVGVSDEPAPRSNWDSARLERSKRRVNIDITPKLCYSVGPMVELLRSSNCSRYLEFRAANRSFVHHEGSLICAPCNREQVFNSKHLKVLEKRLMMKFVTFALQIEESSEEWGEWEKKTDNDLYSSFKLTANLISLIRGSLVISQSSAVLAHESLLSVQWHLRNVGVFGAMPYLAPIYGAGELPQAFARFSAVFGGVYALGETITSLLTDEEGNFSQLILGNGQKMSGKFCVLSPNFSTDRLRAVDCMAVNVAHSVYLSEASIKEKTKSGEQDDVSTLHLLPGTCNNPLPVSGVEFGPRSCVPAEDMYILHLNTVAGGSGPVADLEAVADTLSKNANILYKVFFTTSQRLDAAPNLNMRGNVVQTSHPTFNTAYRECVGEARKVFELLYPGELFMPPAPDPEDIKWPHEEVPECVTEPEDPNTVEPESVEEVTKAEEEKTDGLETAAESTPDQSNTEESKQSDQLDSEPSNIQE